MSALRFLSPRLLVLGFVAALCVAMPAHAQQEQRATQFIQNLGNNAIGILANQSLPADEAARRFRKMLHDNFDLNLLGKFALGANTWRSLNEQQRQEYSKLFEQLVVDIYSDRFKTYSGESFKVGQARAENGTDTYVTSFIVKPQASAQPVQVDWRVRDSGGRPRIIDVIVEGVSMSVSKRSEFSAAIQQQGGDFNAFLELLRQKVNEGKTGMND